MIGRSSTTSLPLTESQKQTHHMKESLNNIDIPLQRNFSNLNREDVSPILEDEKGEETFIGDINNDDLSSNLKYSP